MPGVVKAFHSKSVSWHNRYHSVSGPFGPSIFTAIQEQLGLTRCRSNLTLLLWSIVFRRLAPASGPLLRKSKLTGCRLHADMASLRG